ncbi:MAG: hypothetical protein P8I99_14145 [Acidimicrobiales bacterium]|nr:hypothetical protein [Acidimicrobiales bacterium]
MVPAKAKREFPRRLWGYHRRDVDHRLAEIDTSINLMQVEINATELPDDRDDLVLRATRRSVADVLMQAHSDADTIRSAAEAEAVRLLADAYKLVRDREVAWIDARHGDTESS